ncbi:MAG: cell division protein ZapE [Alphaproteobacteria bacterium]
MSPDSGISVAAPGPLAEWRARTRDGALAEDAMQEQAALRLQALHDALAARAPAGGGWAARLGLAKRRDDGPAPRGLYIHGPVGRGKSLLMDMFMASAPVARKRRVHFHAFMIEVHERLHALRRKGAGSDPLMTVAGDIAGEVRLLCFDEFRVINIADAMILGRLFQGLFERGVVIIATSNVAPRDLYAGGLQRERFLPFIDLLCARMDVLDFGAGTDYRLARLRGRAVWHTPPGELSRRKLDEAFAELTDGEAGEAETIEVQGRTLAVPLAARGVARFDFEALCFRALGPADYIALARRYHTLVIDDIPRLTPERRDVALRFVALVDALYEHKTKLIASAAARPEAICPEGDAAFEYRRTASRLAEMQAADYWDATHIG